MLRIFNPAVFKSSVFQTGAITFTAPSLIFDVPREQTVFIVAREQTIFTVSREFAR